MKVYLAGPIHHKENNGRDWRDIVTARSSFEVLNPLDQFDGKEGAKPIEIITDDLSMINEADALLVKWEQVPTAGTPMELFYASYWRDMPVITVFDGEGRDLSPWIQYWSTDIVSSLSEAVTVIETEV